MVAGAAWPWLASALIGLAVAAWLFQRSRRATDLVLAAVLAVRALLDGAIGLRQAAPLEALVVTVVPVAYVAATWSVIGLWGTHRTARAGRPPSRQGAVLIGLLAAASLVVVVAWPSSWMVQARLGDSLVALGAGPFFVASGLLHLLLAAFSLDLVRYHIKRSQQGNLNRGPILVALGLSFLASFVAAAEWWRVDAGASGQGVWFQVTHWILLASILPVAATALTLGRAAFTTADEGLKRALATFLLVFLLPPLSVATLALLEGLGEAVDGSLAGLEGLWSLVAPVLVAAGLARSAKAEPTDSSKPGVAAGDDRLRAYHEALLAAMVDGQVPSARRSELEHTRLRLRLSRIQADAAEDACTLHVSGREDEAS